VAILNMPKSKIGKVEVPIRGFLGTIGTAPTARMVRLARARHPRANMDFNES